MKEQSHFNDLSGLTTQSAIMKLNIQVAPSRYETMLVYEGDTAKQVATQFVAKHGLNQDVISILTTQIQNSITIQNSLTQLPKPQPRATNPGTRLYHDGLRYKRKSEENLELLRYELNQPYVKPATKQLRRYSSEKTIRHKPLPKSPKYPFKPKICNNSVILDQQRNQENLLTHEQDRYQQLYNEARIRQLKLKHICQKYQVDYSFQPSLVSEQLLLQDTFNTRMDLDIKRRSQTPEKKVELPVRRSLSGGPEGRRSEIKRAGSVFNYLYNQQPQQIEPQQEPKPRPFTAKKQSQKLHHQMLQTKFTQLFFIIQENDIVKAPINKSLINIKAYKLLKPLISELESLQESLDQDEFTQSCINLYGSLSIGDRHQLLDFYRPQKDQKPRRQKETRVVERLQLAIDQKQQKIKKLRQIQEVQETQQCTFEPKISKLKVNKREALVSKIMNQY